MIASLLIAVGLVAIGYGALTAISGAGEDDLPDEIQHITPVENAVQVPQQTQIVVDLIQGYEGRLVIDDQEFVTNDLADVAPRDPRPGQQVDAPAGVVYEVGNATLTFTPSSDAGLAEFGPGNHEVQVVYWKSTEGPNRAESFRWTFNVV